MYGGWVMCPCSVSQAWGRGYGYIRINYLRVGSGFQAGHGGLEWTEEGASMLEELTQGGSKDLGLEDSAEGVYPWYVVGCHKGAVEYDVVPGMPCGAPVGVMGVRA